jgi:NADH-quinone oxidoreductase subunit L
MFAGVILTALYMTRQIIYVFFGNNRSASHEARESPRVMTVPLIVLVFCTIFLGAVLTPAWPWLYSYLVGESPRFEFTQLVQPALFVSAALVGAGVGLALFLYRGVAAPERRIISQDPLQEKLPAVFRFLENKMWIDELYDRTVVSLSVATAWLVDWMDRKIWDGIVRGFGVIAQFFAQIVTFFDERGINDGVDDTTAGARGLGRLASVAHSGQVQTYLGVIAIGMLALLLLFAWLA